MATQQKASHKRLIHICIGLGIMILFPYLPISLPEITDVGMQVIGIFLGTIYLWTTTEPLWSCLISVGMLGLSDYAAMGTVLSSLLGNGTAIQMLFLMLFTAALTHYKITPYIVRLIFKIKFANGRPWVLSTVILTGAYLIASFIDPLSAILLFWAIMYAMFKELNMTKDDLYAKLMLMLIPIISLIGSGVAPYRAARIAIFASYAEMSGGSTEILPGSYLAFSFTMGFAILLLNVLACKFIIRPNVDALKNLSLDSIAQEELEPMTLQQKIISWSFALLILLLLFPPMLTSIPIMSLISSNAIGIPMIIVAILCMIRIDNKPVFNFQEVMSQRFGWGIYLLACTAMLYGTVLTADSVGTKAMLTTVLSPFFNGMSPLLFAVLLLIIATILTNIANNLVIQTLLLPIILTYVASAGIDGAAYVALLSFVVSATSFMTPAASAYTAVMYGNKEWLSNKDLYKYTPLFAAIGLLGLIVIGIPLSQLCLG